MNGKWCSGLLAALLSLGVTVAAEEYPALKGVPVKGAEKISGAVGYADGYLHAAGVGRYLIYDCRKDPVHPEKIAEITAADHLHSRQIVIHKGFAYVTSRQFGLGIFDVRDVRNPKYCGNFDTSEYATGIEASGNLLFIATRNYGIEIFDISEPENPKQISRFKTREAQSCYARGTKLAVGNWGAATAQIFDVSDPCNVKELCFANLDGHGDGVWFDDNYLYAATGHHSRTGSQEEAFGRGHGLEIFSLKSSGEQKRVAKLKFPRFYMQGTDMWGVFPAGKLICVADTHNGFFLVDHANPAAPKVVGRFQLPIINWPEKRLSNHDFSIAETRRILSLPGAQTIPCADAVFSAVSGDGAVYCCGLSSGVWAVRVPEATAAPKVPQHPGKDFPHCQFQELPGFTHLTFDEMVRNAAPAGERLYVAAGRDGAWCLTRKQGKIVREKISKDYASSIDCNNGILAIGGKMDLTIFREGKNGKLTFISKTKMPRSPLLLHLYCGGTIALTCEQKSSFFLFDLRNPAKPKKIELFKGFYIFYSDYFPDALVKDLLPVSNRKSITWLQLSPGKVKKVAVTKGKCAISFTRFRDGYLLAAGRGVNLLAVDDLGAAGVKSKVKINSPTSGMPAWDGGEMVWFATRTSGLVSVIDFEKKPKCRKLLKLMPGTPGKVKFWQGKAVIPAGFAGLYVQE